MSAPMMPLQPPRIPDHEVLRCIGRGSYGEVWMALAVTGALRAVKVVRRADFEMERTFEREFEGIRSFEPISRSHPGLIDILHVGRNAEEGFYFCVMELADDRYNGRAIVPAEYEPRTLSSDKKETGTRDLDAVIEVGRRLAEALAHLHRHGLIHRDVKPSNVIFINGMAQLADIGLVAASGQRTYVGTEGFVPPEGPGTPQADMYSLGMVLYELSTGKDRLEFPALPDDLEGIGDRRKWRALNEVVCRACAPDPGDRYVAADEMAEDLRRVLDGGRARPRGIWRYPGRWAAVAAAVALIVWGGQAWLGRAPLAAGVPQEPGPATGEAGVGEAFPFVGPPMPETGRLRLTSVPPGAEVWIDGTLRGRTPVEVAGLPVGTVPVTYKLDQYREETKLGEVVAGEVTEVPVDLAFWSPPVSGSPWKNSLGLEFAARGDGHVALLPTTREEFIQAHDGQFREGEVLPWVPPGATDPVFIVFVPRRDAEVYRLWMEERDRARGYFGTDHFYRLEEIGDGISPTRDDTTHDHLSFRLVAGQRRFGRVVLHSTPPGAEVFAEGERLGVTPLTLDRRPVGPVQYELRLTGHHPRRIEGEVADSQRLELMAELERSGLAVFDQEWQNGLGQIFRPVGGLQFCIWETRVRDYGAFLEATGRTHRTDMDQAPDHPVIGVDRAEAMDFCRWLTEKERAEGRLEAGWAYRLPTDLEWSLAAGVPSERGLTPRERNSRIRGVYPWGYYWPPKAGDGNFADRTAAGKVALERPGDRLVPGADQYAFTAPVGTFAASASGLYDLGGNVWEWVMEDFGSGAASGHYDSFGVLRGGSWADYRKNFLLTSFRNAVPATQRDSNIGFRVVLSASGGEVPVRRAEPVTE